jgi:hypothetical protein
MKEGNDRRNPGPGEALDMVMMKDGLESIQSCCHVDGVSFHGMAILEYIRQRIYLIVGWCAGKTSVFDNDGSHFAMMFELTISN